MKVIYISILSFLQVAMLFSDIGGLGSVNFIADKSTGDRQMTLTSSGLGITTTSPDYNLHNAGNTLLVGPITVGNGGGSSNLNLAGTLSQAVKIVTADTTLDAESLVLVNSTASSVNIILPSADAANLSGRIYEIAKTSANNTVWVDGGGTSIGENESMEMSWSDKGSSHLKVISDGSRWNIISASSDVSPAVATANLLAWWRLEEIGDSVVLQDSVSGSYPGTINTGGNGLVGGVRGSGIFLDGVDDYLDFGAISDFNTHSALSFSIWVKFTESTYDDFATVMDRRDGDSGMAIKFNNNASVGLRAEVKGVTTPTDTRSNIDSIDPVARAEWQHLVATTDGNANHFYINGHLQGTINNAVDFSSANKLVVGAKALDVTNNLAKLAVDEIRVYGKALSSSEVMKLYRAR